MLAQEILETVGKHLLTQNRKCMSENIDGLCMYRGPHGCKCGIGILIPDNLYARYAKVMLLEGRRVDTMPELFLDAILPTDMPRNVGEDFLMELQEVHDMRNPDEWQEELTYVGGRFNLDIKFLAEVQA